MRLRAFLADERGLSAVEYILVAALITLTLFGIMATIFEGLQGKYQAVNDNL